jgi:U6 snRNA phosphodiesterase
MALVSYTSASEASDSGSEPDREPPSSSGPAARKRKTAHSGDGDAAATTSSLPPLPAAFHDLYASTVRPSNVDDPSLHQGRRRLIPHVVGQWPSHLYIEWRPTGPEHAVLAALVDGVSARWRALQKQQQHHHEDDANDDGNDDDDDHARQKRQKPLYGGARGSSSTSSSSPGPLASQIGGDSSAAISTFLTSDLGTPQPLHISLSRPLSLSTAQKNAFLARLQRVLASLHLKPGGKARTKSSGGAGGGGGGAAFMLRPTALEWHRTSESSRSFLVLRVQAEGGALTGETEAAAAAVAEDGKGGPANPPQRSGKNPELSTLLEQCNRLCRTYKQPELYAFASSAADGGGKEGGIATVGDAFHVSVAWTFAAPTAPLRQATDEVFARHAGRVRAMSLPVDGVKAKIGNVVTHIGLSSSSSSASNGGERNGGRENTKGTYGLF